MSSTRINTVEADGIKIFYREVGQQERPVLLLLHGFPSSSHQFRNLIPLLSSKYRVIAPDLPGYGFTEVPESRKYVYTFDNIATSIEAFLDVLNIKHFSVYIFDYGAPTGLRLALRRPEAIQSIISQNGNAYEEGFGAEFWAPVRKFWENPTSELRETIKSAVLNLETTKWQYENGAKGPVAPEAYWLDYTLFSREGNKDIQLDLLYDYRNNLPLYPKFQQYFRDSNVPILAVWGRNDDIFIAPGAEAYERDSKNAEVHLLDAGHFAVENETQQVADLILEFLAKHEI